MNVASGERAVFSGNDRKTRATEATVDACVGDALEVIGKHLAPYLKSATKKAREKSAPLTEPVEGTQTPGKSSARKAREKKSPAKQSRPKRFVGKFALLLATEKPLKALEERTTEFGALAHGERELVKLAKLQVQPVPEFVSTDELAELVGDDMGDLPELKESWFSAKAGLKSVVALLEVMIQAPGRVSDPEGIAADLEDLRDALELLEKKTIRWHFSWHF